MLHRYCFGRCVVLELARDGIPRRGVVSLLGDLPCEALPYTTTIIS